MGPLAFLLGNSLLAGTGASTVLQLIEQKGLALAKQLLRSAATAHLDAKAAKVTAKMIADGWAVGKPYPKHAGRTIAAADMTHDVLYRIVALYESRGGFIKDQIRDYLDHVLGAELLASVPTGDPTE